MPAARAAAELRGAAAAVAFLTRLPLVGRCPRGGEEVARGAWAFPLAGAAVGAAAAAVALAAEGPLGSLAAAAAATAAAVLLTGALHLDGLADAADGLGAPTRERALAAMRDHAVGAFGATAIGLDLLLRTTLVAALIDGPGALGPLVAAAAISRTAVLPLPVAVPYAQPVPGHGAALSGGGGGARAALAAAVAAALSFALVGEAAAAALVAAALLAATLGLLARRRFGGVSGDVLGATVELVELACLATLLALA